MIETRVEPFVHLVHVDGSERDGRLEPMTVQAAGGPVLTPPFGVTR